LLSLPASFFKVLPLPFPEKFNRFHILAPCFMKTAFGSSKSQMLPRLLSLPASFFKVLPLPQKFNRFRFHIPGRNKETIAIHMLCIVQYK